MAERYQVVIVGGGPVGVGLAVELGQRGISTALVERHLEPQRIPKGQGLTSRTLEHLYYWGCAEELRAARLLPRGSPIASLTAYGSLMSDYWFVAQQPIGRGGGRSFYFQANERLPQYLTERVLRNRLAEIPSVTTMFGRSAKSFQYGDHGVLVTVADEGWPYEEVTLDLRSCGGEQRVLTVWLL
jgi:2-polyprenyl-6-methoxyphenol hydroxylase-like FAD-dependent oxidoreductase